MRVKKEDVRRILKQFSTTVFMIGIFLFLWLIMGAINGYLNNQIETATNKTIAILDGDIDIAKSIVIKDEVFTNIGNVVYDPERCTADDTAVFAALKPIVSYDNADTYNNARQSVMDSTHMDLFDDIFLRIDYKEGIYTSEKDYHGKSKDAYKCEPKKFNSFVMGIHDDRYDYVAILNVQVTEPTMFGTAVHKDDIILNYSTTKEGEIDYTTVHAMRCTGRAN